MPLYELTTVRKLPNGRYQVVRSDGAMLSLTADNWMNAIEQMEHMILDDMREGSSEG